MNSVQDIVRTLTDANNTQPPRGFPVDPIAAGHAGIYAWSADDVARNDLGAPLGLVLPPMIYVGQAGATKWPSGTSSRATLKSRIGQQHIRGNARSSTFRLTISALLLEPLQLSAAGGGRLTDASNARVSSWIAEHLRVAIAPVDDRDRLASLEAEVVAALNPPLNLGHCLPTSARQSLTELRSVLRRH